MVEERLTWFAGIDWGSERHQACLLDAQGNIVAEREFPHSGAGLAELGDWLLSIAGAASTVAVAIEVPHGPVVESLVDRGFVVHAINPKQLDRLRDRFSVAGAKDDRRDAYVLADGVRTDRRLFRRLHVADPRLIELRAWSRLAEELKEEQRRLSNRVGQQLWRYYPQMQKLTDDLAAPWFLELWAIAPTPAKARQLRKPTVERLLRQHRIRRVDADTVLGTLREPSLKVADGVAEAASIHLRSLVARLRVVNRELRSAGGQLEKLCRSVGETEAASGECLRRQDILILRSLPGIGRINLAALLCEASGPLGSRDYRALRTLCGAAPVTRRSGKSRIVVMRYAAHVRLRNTVYHWARVASQRDPKCRAKYAALRQRGHSHGRALRGVADRLLALACVLLQRQTLFDPHFVRAG
jgi:transposase